MTKFTYDDIVRVRHNAGSIFRPGKRAWVVGVTPQERRVGSHYDQFPAGTIYTIEFEDGDSIDIHEEMLELE